MRFLFLARLGSWVVFVSAIGFGRFGPVASPVSMDIRLSCVSTLLVCIKSVGVSRIILNLGAMDKTQNSVTPVSDATFFLFVFVRYARPPNRTIFQSSPSDREIVRILTGSYNVNADRK